MPSDTAAYGAAGVNLAAGDATAAMLAPLAATTHGPRVPRGLGLFGGLYDASVLKEMRRPLLVSSLDGVGTKTRLAATRGRAALRGIGRDLVNHCVNDVAVQAARPLFFLDYLAFDRLEPAVAADLVAGMAEACRAVDVALIGGETAEMPAVYREGEYDVVGCMVGVVEAEDLVDGRDIEAGDVLLGLPSSGLHTNGYSLAAPLLPELQRGLSLSESAAVVDDLLAPHRCYLRDIELLRAAVPVRGLAHITGGGIPGNLARILPNGHTARVDVTAWSVPPIFRQLREAGNIDACEMYRVFNMGIGLIAVVPRDAATRATALLPEARVIGRIVGSAESGAQPVQLEGVIE